MPSSPKYVLQFQKKKSAFHVVMSILLLHTIYLVACPATDNFKGALPNLADTKIKVGTSHEKRHEKHRRSADKEHFIREKRRTDKTSSYSVPT